MSRRDRYNRRKHNRYSGSDYTRLGIERDQRQLGTGISIYEFRKKYEGKNMEIPIKEHKKIPDGEHEGIVIGVEYRKPTYNNKIMEYTDYCIGFIVDNERVNVKASYPTNLTPETIHGRMLSRFGLEIVAGLKVDPDKLIGLKCAFSTVNKTTPKGTFPEVMRDTLKPLPVKAEIIPDTRPSNTGIPVKPAQPGEVPSPTTGGNL